MKNIILGSLALVFVIIPFFLCDSIVMRGIAIMMTISYLILIKQIFSNTKNEQK